MKKNLWRGICKIDNRWRHGELSQMEQERRTVRKDKAFIIFAGRSSYSEGEEPYEGILRREVYPETVGAYTETNDKHCAEIFEGDIVKWIPEPEEAAERGLLSEYIGVVKWLQSISFFLY